MDDTTTTTTTGWDHIRLRRGARKGKLTRLARLLDESCILPLDGQSPLSLSKINYEELMSNREDITQDTLAREMDAGEEAKDGYSDLSHKAEIACLTLSRFAEAQTIKREYNILTKVSDPAAAEFEYPCF